MPESPGGSLAKRPLQFIYIVDCSGSMEGKPIAALNNAIKESIKPMQDVAEENPNAQILVRAITFSDGAQWHISQPTDISKFTWKDVNAAGVTDMGKALAMVAEALKTANMPARGLPPVLVLISDGQPTDDFAGGLKALMAEPWGMKAVRIGVYITDNEGNTDGLEALQKFIGSNETKPLVASNVQDLVKKIKWASTVPLKAASNPGSHTKGDSTKSNVTIPAQPQDAAPGTAADSW